MISIKQGIIYDDTYIELDVGTDVYRFYLIFKKKVHRFAINYHRSLQNKATKFHF